MSKEKLKRRNFAWIPFVTLTIMILVVVTPIYGDFNPAATIQDPTSQIYMDQLVYEFDSPPTIVGDTFYVDVIGYNISEVFSYQVVIDYNATLLSCLDTWPDGGGWTDPEWIFYDLQTWGVAWMSYVDAPSVGRNAELVGDSLKNAEDTVNLTDPASEALLARFEFEILAVPEPYEELSCVLSITSSWAVGTYVQSAEEASAFQKRSPDMTNSEYRNRSSTIENEPPVADDDSYSTNENTTLSVPVPGVLGNDTDVNLDLLTAENFSDVSHGTLNFNSDGSFTYTPDLGYTGSDSFTYKAWDGQEYSNLATVTITVNPPQVYACRLYVDPPEIIDPNLMPPATINVNITIDDVESMHGYEFKLGYDSDVLICIGVVVHSVLDEPHYIPNVNIDNVAGIIMVNVTYYPPAVPITTDSPGALATITFRIKAMGSSILDLYDTNIVDQTGQPITHEVEDGFVMTLVRDVAIVDVITSRNEVFQGWIVNITVVAKNEGNLTETFDVNLYYGSDLLATYTVTDLDPNNETTFTFSWDTKDVPPCHNDTISAEAPPIPFEVDTGDNVFEDGYVKIKLEGDIDGDDMVTIADISAAAMAFGSYPGHPRWNPIADLDQDNMISIVDVAVVAVNFGKSC